jgi:tRNA(fMet)-specific endonuclease VapC
MFVLDTDFIINIFRNKEGNVKLLKKLIDDDSSEIFITSITLYELLKGCYKSKNFDKNYNIVSNFVSNLNILDFSANNSKIAAKIHSDLEKKGKIIEESDILIASICIEKNYVLITENFKHFENIEELKIYR